MTIYTDLSQIPRKQYGVIYADAPWHYKSYSIKGQQRSPSRHYETMSLQDIKNMPVADLAAKNCHLMFWATQPHLKQAFEVLDAWGFPYSSVFKFWLKLNPRAADEAFLELRNFHNGQGFTTRKNVELCLLARRGKPKRLVNNERDFIIAARRAHSQKPDGMYPAIERYSTGPYLELFGRQSRAGWDTYGNSVDVPIQRPAKWSAATARPQPEAPMPETPLFTKAAE